jgi:hypothetical protein
MWLDAIIPGMTKSNHIAAKSKFKHAILLLIAPSILFAFSLLMLAIINLIFNPTFWMTGDTEPVNSTPLIITVFNVLFIITGIVGLISFLPGVVVGVLLLVQSKQRQAK